MNSARQNPLSPLHEEGRTDRETGFFHFDGALRQLDQGGNVRVVIARTPSDASRALIAHTRRRLHARGFQVVIPYERTSTLVFAEVVTRLTGASTQVDPFAVAESIRLTTRSKPAVIIAHLPDLGTWDREVAVEIAASGAACLVLFSDSLDQALDLSGAKHAELSAVLDPAEFRLWFEVLADATLSTGSHSDIVSLENRWNPEGAVSAHERTLSNEDKLALATLSALGVGFTQTDALRLFSELELGDATVFHTLVARGFIASDDEWFSVVREVEAPVSSASRIAELLVKHYREDPLILVRAASLFLSAGDIERGDAAHASSTARVRHPALRRHILATWQLAVAARAPEERLKLYQLAAERALATGEADEASQWAELSIKLSPDNVEVALLHGRSLIASGDLVAGNVVLDRARTMPRANEFSAVISVELAEAAIKSGLLDRAKELAEAALASDPAPSARMRARNVLGKILLANEQWSIADEHFAADVFTAGALQEPVAELRARLNRAVALISRGQLEEARGLLEVVEREGTRLGNPVACAFAVENLAVIATWRRDYGSALRFTERGLEYMIQAGDRITMALVLYNLAELRFRVGRYEHAEHAVVFGRRTIGPGMPPAASARFSLMSSRLALARGNTTDAWREIQRSLSYGKTSTTAQAYLVSTRIALEDGNTEKAKDSLSCAIELASTELIKAEARLLSAYVKRAVGDDYSAEADRALAELRLVGDEELLREVHMLLFDKFRAADDVESARAHLVQAEELRDRIAGTLEGEVRAAFLAKRDVALLAGLRQEIEDRGDDKGMPAEADKGIPSLRRPKANAPPREMVGNDPALRSLLVAIRKVGASDSTVLIHGESGTGKELVAEAIHRASTRAQGPLVSVNCAALVETLLLSELFGHEKGSFTGAGARRRGRFELSEGGTLFLDEIGDISPRTQVALLRVLQEKTFERVGGSQPIRVNVRIVCATHRDLRAMVERGEFREDLYYRLRGVILEVPALRSRLGDLPALAEHLLQRIAEEQGQMRKTLSSAALELLARYKWPGNIRELENALRVAYVFSESSVIAAKEFIENVEELRALARTSSPPEGSASLPPPSMSSFPSGASGPVSQRFGSVVPTSGASIPNLGSVAGEDEDLGAAEIGSAELPLNESDATDIVYSSMKLGHTTLSDIKRQIERDCIARALAETKGNITRAAQVLGMKRPRLSQLVKQYGLLSILEES